ncbi:MAG: site-2 protease family protein [Alphaproteobacteria bacterium]|nr:site-2 protease family protein [Alphaproteobacteria bacterium]
MSPLVLVAIPVIGYLAAALHTILHELAHALAGQAVGIQIQEIRIWHGEPLFRLRVGETVLTVGRGPVGGGLVQSYPQRKQQRWRMMMFVAAGPAMDIVFILVALRVGAGGGWFGFAGLMAALVGAVVLAVSAVPRRVTLFGEVRANDLLLLWQVTMTRPAVAPIWPQYEKAVARYWNGTGPVPGMTRQSERIVFHLLGNPGVPDEAGVGALEREIARKPHPAEAAYVLDVLTTRALLAGRDDLIGRMDSWSSTALALRPELATLQGSRGAVLGLLGRHDEALAIFDKVTPSCDFDGLMVEVCAARSLFHRGEGAAAVTRFEAALARSGGSVGKVRADVQTLVRRIGEEIGARLALLSTKTAAMSAGQDTASCGGAAESEEALAPRLFIEIVRRPKGDGPDWVHDQWIGLRLPLVAGHEPRGCEVDVVLRRGSDAVVVDYGGQRIGGRRLETETWNGFRVNGEEAVAVLEKAGRMEAAGWWRGDMLLLSREWIFDSACAELVAQEQDGS